MSSCIRIRFSRPVLLVAGCGITSIILSHPYFMTSVFSSTTTKNKNFRWQQ